MFPNMVAAAKKGAEADLEDLIHLQKQTIGMYVDKCSNIL